jgi:hypothetical protein
MIKERRKKKEEKCKQTKGVAMYRTITTKTNKKTKQNPNPSITPNIIRTTKNTIPLKISSIHKP